MASYKIDLHKVLQQAVDHDKDVRVVAMDDLCGELEKDQQLDASMEKKVGELILDRLEVDPSHDVQSGAVKCLQAIMKRAGDAQVKAVATNLTKHILSGARSDMRDVYCVGMTHAISQVAPAFGATLGGVVLPGMLTGANSDDAGLQRDAMQVAAELLKRFGDKVPEHLDAASKAFLARLQSPAHDVRKRATAALGALSQHLDDAQLEAVVKQVLAMLDGGASDEARRAAIRTISSVARVVGYRLGRHLDGIVPLFLSNIGHAEDDAAMGDAGNELREACFQALASFVKRCPAEVTAHLDAVTDRSLEFLSFDPNFDYDAVEDDEDEDEYGSDDEELLDMEDDYGGYDDGEEDDDTTWKVRRSAVSVLLHIIESRQERLQDLYAKAAQPLVVQFREREQGVRVDVMHCFASLLKATVVVEGSAADRTVQDAPAGSAEAGEVPVAPPPMLQPAPLVRQRSAGPTLNAMTESVVTAVVKALGKTEVRDVKTRSAGFEVLRDLVLAAGDSLPEMLGEVLAVVSPAVTDSNANVRLGALLLLRQLPDCVPSYAFPEHLGTMTALTVSALGDVWFKAVSEGLRIAGRLALLMHSTGAKDAGQVSDLYDAILPKLASTDLDQEIKEMAITSMGLLVAHLGDVLGEKVGATYPLFLARLGADNTRLAALKAIGHLAESPLGLDLASVTAPSGATVLSEVVDAGVALTRQASWQLAHATLLTLTALVKSHGAKLASAADELLDAVAAILGGSDLNLAQTSMRLAGAVITFIPGSAASVSAKVVPGALALVASPALQGVALDDCKSFFHSIVTVGGGDAAGLVGKLASSVASAGGGAATGAGGEEGGVQKQTLVNLAQVSAVVLAAGPAAGLQDAVQAYLSDAASDSVSPVQRALSLQTLAEVGTTTDVLAIAPSALDIVSSAFTASSEDVKSAAAAALGGVSVGAPATGLPALFAKLSGAAHGGHYLLLTALHEVLKRHAPASAKGPDFSAHVDSVLPVLATRAAADDEGERNVVAQCLGLVVGVAPAAGLGALSTMVGDASPNTRWTAVTAVKGCLHSAAATAALGQDGVITPFLSLLQDADLTVRLGAMQTLHALVHSATDIVRHLFLPTAPAATGAAEGKDEAPSGTIAEVGIMPVLCYEMTPHPELQRKVDVGPFKVDVDDGEALRKAAFSTMDSVVQKLRERVTEVVMEKVLGGLNDLEDIKLLAHQLLVKMTGYEATKALIVGFLKAICEAFIVTFQQAAKASKGSSAAGGSDTLRSSLRAINAIDKHVGDARSTREFMTLVVSCETQEPLKGLLAQIRTEGSA